jgi:predicted acylesterase/phospholipase RssA
MQGASQLPTLSAEYSTDGLCRVLSLDGGGAKGFYTLGVLKEIEAMLNCPLYKRFDLVFGTSTGGIIAALIALGYSVDQIHRLYTERVPSVMRCRTRRTRTAALETLAKEVFGESTFRDVKTGIGIVAARWMTERPIIFKGRIEQAHGSKGTFVPGFGVLISDAVQASCAAFPFFDRKVITTDAGDEIEVIDGGYCANNPTLYAIADATAALNKQQGDLRIVSIGVGVYPAPKKFHMWLLKRIPFNSIELLQKTLEINTQSMDQLRTLLFRDVPTIRISDVFERPEMATDLLEHDLEKLGVLRQRGRESFGPRESQLKAFLT